MNTERGEREEAPRLLLDDDELVAEMNTAAENLVGEWYRESQHRDELVEEVAVTLTAAHRRAEANAAARMRERCVAKLDSLAGYGTNELVCAALGMAARSLESITLEAAANSVKDSEDAAPEA